MAEELKFVLTTEAQGAEDAQYRATRAIQQVGKVFTAIRESVRQTASETNASMNAIKQQVSSTAAEMSSRYNAMSLTQLQNEFVKLEEKIRSQAQALRQAEEEFEEYSKFNTQFNGDQFNGFLEQLGEKANQAEDGLRSLQEAQAQVAAAINVKIQGQQEVDQLNAQLKETKTQSAQTRMGLDAVANGLTIVGRASGGTASQIAGIVQEVRFLKQGFTATAATAGTSAAIISTAFGVAGIVIMAIMTVINAVVAATEKEKERLKEIRQEIEDLQSNNQGAAKLISEYEELNKKIIKSADDTQRMLDIRAELVETYGFAVGAVSEEGVLLSGNLELMKEQLKVAQELLLTKLQESQSDNENTFDDSFNSYASNMQKLSEAQQSLAAARSDLDYFTSTPGTHQETINNLILQIANYEHLEEKLKKNIASNKASIAEAIKSIFQVMVLTAQTEGKNVPEALQLAMSTALNKAIEQAFEQGRALTNDEVKAFIQNMINSFNEIDALVPDSDVPIVQAFIDSLKAGFAGANDGEAAAEFINGVLDNLFAGADEEAYARAEELGKRIYEGLASPEEIAEYDALMAQIEKSINEAISNASSRAEVDALYELKNAAVVTSDELIRMAAEAEAVNMTVQDAADSLRSMARAYESVSDAMEEVARLKGAVQALVAYTSGRDQSAEAEQRAAEARRYLAEQYGVEEDAVDAMLPKIQEDIYFKETLARVDYEVALAAIYMAKAQITAMIAMRTIAEDEGQRMLNVLESLIAKMEELGSMRFGINGEIKADSSKGFSTSSGSGGGSSTNKALQKQLDLIEHKKALDKITTAEEIALLEKALAKYAKTTAEKEDLTEKLYALRKQKAEEELEYQKAMDQLTLREEIAAVEAMMVTYKAGTQARREMETELYQLKRELERQEYDLAVYYGQLTLEEQEAAVRAMIETYEEGVKARIDLEKELYDIQQQIRQRDIDRLNSLIDATISALRTRYDAQREAEKDTLEASIKTWKDWGDEQVEAIQRQIDALDELAQEEDDAEVEAAKRRKISMLEQALLYEQDAYNRRKLQEQLAAAQNDLTQWLRDKEREAAKKALQEQINDVNETVDTQTDALQEQIDAVDAYYDELTEAQRLQAEAQQLLMQSTQEDIIALLASYAPEYNATGQSLGDQFIDGFTSRFGSIETWFQGLIAGLSSNVSNYLQRLANVANAAANQYAANSGSATTTTDSYNNTKTISPVININITATGADGGVTPSERQEMIDDIVAALSEM